MQAVIDLARLLHWRVFHTFDSRHSEAGFPDLVMVRRGEVVCAEIKSERGRVSPKQQEWLEALCEVPGIRCFVWRPCKWAEIESVLG